MASQKPLWYHYHGWVSNTFLLSGNVEEKMKLLLDVSWVIYISRCILRVPCIFIWNSPYLLNWENILKAHIDSYVHNIFKYLLAMFLLFFYFWKINKLFKKKKGQLYCFKNLFQLVIICNFHRNIFYHYYFSKMKWGLLVSIQISICNW